MSTILNVENAYKTQKLQNKKLMNSSSTLEHRCRSAHKSQHKHSQNPVVKSPQGYHQLAVRGSAHLYNITAIYTTTNDNPMWSLKIYLNLMIIETN